jgi:tRNA A-37 threonylcarbamoyl transferase component Bud32
MKTQNFGNPSQGCSIYSPDFTSVTYLGGLASVNTLADYRKNRENGSKQDNPARRFPSMKFEKLDIKKASSQQNKWPDQQDRYWWKLILQDGRVISDFYWMKDTFRGYPERNNKNRHWISICHAPSGTKIEGFSQENDYQKGFPDQNKKYWYSIQFTDTHCPAIRQWMEEKDLNYLRRIQKENPTLYAQEIQTAHPNVQKILMREETKRERNTKAKLENIKQQALSEDTLQQMALFVCYEEITIQKKLNEGAFGEVFQGHWHYEDVAVKKLHLQHLSDDALKAFKDEATIMARLHSDYIVTLKGVCLTPYALVMEYMRGGSLFDLLHRDEILPWAIRHRLATDIAKGLAFLHQHNPVIIHRDLKSHNVLLNHEFRAKLSDFGLSKVRVESSLSQTHTQSAKNVGTVPWMAPECFGIRPKYSEKSDTYAYGMVLWEIATRKMPYEEVTDATEIRDAVKAGDREEIPEETANPAAPLPTSYKKLIQVCWFQAPDKRPTAKEAIERLDIDNPITGSTSSTSNSSSYSGFFSGFLSNFSSQK